MTTTTEPTQLWIPIETDTQYCYYYNVYITNAETYTSTPLQHTSVLKAFKPALVACS